MPSDSLTVTDNRTGKRYELPIANGGSWPTAGAPATGACDGSGSQSSHLSRKVRCALSSCRMAATPGWP